MLNKIWDLWDLRFEIWKRYSLSDFDLFNIFVMLKVWGDVGGVFSDLFVFILVIIGVLEKIFESLVLSLRVVLGCWFNMLLFLLLGEVLVFWIRFLKWLFLVVGWELEEWNILIILVCVLVFLSLEGWKVIIWFLMDDFGFMDLCMLLYLWIGSCCFLCIIWLFLFCCDINWVKKEGFCMVFVRKLIIFCCWCFDIWKCWVMICIVE